MIWVQKNVFYDLHTTQSSFLQKALLHVFLGLFIKQRFNKIIILCRISCFIVSSGFEEFSGLALMSKFNL